MTDQELYDRQEAAKTQFDNLAAQKAQKDTEIEEIILEMNRLQGDWRTYGKLREELVATGDPATTIVATPAVDAPVKVKKNGK